MDKICQRDIERSVKKHVGFALILAMAPILFLALISLFTDGLNWLLVFIMPIAVVGACAEFVKRVLVDLCVSGEQDH